MTVDNESLLPTDQMTVPRESSQQVPMLTLRCMNNECLLRLRIGRILSLPTPRVGALRYCPLCGKDAIISTDNEESYWEALARAYELPVPILKEIFGIWDSTKYPRLKDFVDEIKRDAAKINAG